MPLDQYVLRDGRRMRFGVTTGSCAALAAGGAARLLLSGRPEPRASLVAPNGTVLTADLLDAELKDGAAACAVRKDAGDDPDVTDGVLVRAVAKLAPGEGVDIDGGPGVGRVTRRGLDQPPGAAAINSVPRRMIEAEVRRACREHGYAGGMSIVISVPDGERLAARTFNPHLGIVGGISVIGTTGVVEPLSRRAVLATIELEMKAHRADGVADMIVTPGNYGEEFVKADPALSRRARVKCANHLGEALDLAGALGFARVLVVGHVGKLVKVAGGIMDTHSRTADARLELVALQAALAGADKEEVRAVLAAATVDDGLDRLERLGVLPEAVAGLLERVEFHLRRRAAGTFATGAVLFSKFRGLVGRTDGAAAIMAEWEKADA